MAISLEILKRRLLETKEVISEKLEVIKTTAAGEYEKVKKSITLPDSIKFDINGKERPAVSQITYLEQVTCKSVRVPYLKDIFSAIHRGDLITFQERLEALKYLNQEHPEKGYRELDVVSSDLLKAIHNETVYYRGTLLSTEKEKTYFASDLYQRHMAMLLLLIEHEQGPQLKRLLERGNKALDLTEDSYSIKVPDETRVLAESILEEIEKDIKKQQELAQPTFQSVSLLPAFQKEKERKVLVEESIQSQTISPDEQLFRAVKQGDLVQVRELLEASKPININVSMDVSVEDMNGDTPLIHALNLEHLEIARLLLEKGADPWKKNNIAHSALHALMMVHQKVDEAKSKIMMELLNILLSDKGIQKEINVAALPDGRTPYALAICYPAFKQTKLLLEALTKAGGKYGSDRSYWAACLSADEPFLKLKYMEELFPEEFTTQKLQQKSPYFGNKNALEAAIDMNYVEVAQYIFEKDKKAWQEVMNQKPSILHAIFNSPFSENRPKMVKFFLEEGADPYVRNNLDSTIFDQLDIWETRLTMKQKEFLGKQDVLDVIGKEFKALEAIKEMLKPKVRLKIS